MARTRFVFRDLSDKFIRNFRARFTMRMQQAVAFIEGKVKKKLTGQGSGRWYGNHQASAPGEPPALDTGTLRSSITGIVDEKGLSIRGFVGSNVEYVRDLELGTEKIAPRPFLMPTILENQRRIMKILGGI